MPTNTFFCIQIPLGLLVEYYIIILTYYLMHHCLEMAYRPVKDWTATLHIVFGTDFVDHAH